ncbi:MAG: hypothetical protein K2M48_04360, partial [Clostridiales bacterium]|nr:hypothetical protein [Clostridiales bacterium]
PIVIRLSDYITASGSDSYISFSFGNKNTDFTKFDEMFVDSVTGKQYIELTKSQITVKLLGAPRINFTVTIQRFWGPQGTGTFGGDECVTISFSYTKISPITFSKPNSGNQSSNTYRISREMKFYVFGRTEAPEAERANVIDSVALVSLARDYRNEMTLSNILTTNPDIVTARADSNQVLTITPGKSGTAAIMFTLSAFGKSIPVTLTFNVAGITDIKDKNDENKDIDYTVNLSDVQYVYISELTTGLKNAVGGFITVDDFSVLSTDTALLDDNRTKYAGVEFERVADKDGNIPPMSGYYPEYVQSISFYDMDTDKPYIRFDMDSDATKDDLEKEYTVYVKFVDTKNNGYKTYQEAAGGTILRAAFKLKANKKVAFESGSILEIVADCDNPKKHADNSSNSDWYMEGTDLEAKIYVPLRYICEKAGITNYNEYEIFLVSASANINDKLDPSKYINPVGGSEATLNVIEITPYKNTTLPITLNVSIRNTSKGESENQVVAFTVSVKGISEYLTKDEYIMIWLVAFFSSLGLLMIIFLIRMIVYWRRRAKQRALIKRNQELIKMRDKVHNKASSATRDQAIRTKLKLQDPKYAKMFNEMKKDQNGGVGVATVGDEFGAAEASTGKKSKKKKGGKKSMAELKAELAAKKAAFAQAQSGATVEPMTFGAQPVNPFGDMSGDGFGGPAPDFGGPTPDFGAPGPDFGAPNGAYNPSDLGGNEIIFDAPDIDGQSQG